MIGLKRKLTKMQYRVLFLQKLWKLLEFAESQGIKLIYFSTYRTPEQQHQRFQDGLSKCDGYTKRSKHQDHRAVDLAVVAGNDCVWLHIPEYDVLGQFWKNLGGVWGGDWKSDDIYHFEC